jgi:hypothetical protein
MVMSNEEVRRTIGIRLRPSIIRKARIRATYSNTRLGQWIEEAIEEKAAREEIQLK